MFAKLLIAASLLYATQADTCIHCICLHESGCKAIGCEMDVGSLSCGYYQIKLPYYEDCGTPGRNSGEDVTTAWKRCADDYNCATQCVQAYYNRYKGNCASTGEGTCQVMARNHNGGPAGCKNSATQSYWTAIEKCCACT
ncbi:Destabilase [Oesophagostomum dentatum]|uniref:lysozyme n=1 Tax=Oesophagostomum dentatum TaxID=61180 RepID=A0A0B1TE34_OESDE|nr:Destabilase [Oesophagostomum dentatum]